jgi:hypothetical protein
MERALLYSGLRSRRCYAITDPLPGNHRYGDVILARISALTFWMYPSD